MSSSLYHRNAVPGGPPVKGVECRRCGAYVGIVQSKAGRWYTCQLHRTMNPDKANLVAYPFQPHAKVCGDRNPITRAIADERTEREASLRNAIAKIEALIAATPDADHADDHDVIALWRECLINEGFERNPQ